MLAFERAGQGVPLVFVHAFPLSRKMWEGVKPTFSKNFQFISIDLPGFGASPLSSDISPMEDMARQIIQTLDQIGVKEKFVASGVSMGGYVLFQLARLFPERLRGLGLISTRSAADSPEVRERRFKTIELVEKQGGLKALSEKMIPQLFGKSSLEAKLPAVEEVKTWIQAANPLGVCAALRGMAARPDSTPILEAINIPTLVLSGAEDVFVPSQEMEEMAQHIPGAEFHVVPTAGHLLPLEKPDLYSDLFLQFLKRRVL